MIPTLTQKSQRPLDYISPRIGDIMFYERVPVEKVVDNLSLAYGAAHPLPSLWANHKLAAIKADPNEAGMQRIYWLAERPSQEAYNWELEDDTSTQWPRLVQTWVILRSAFTGLDLAVTAPSAYGHTWTRIGEREKRTGDEITDGLFVVLQVVWEDIRSPLYRQKIDDESGQIVTVEIQKVPAGTAAQQADAQGYIVEVEPINTRWGISTKDKVSAMMGAGVRSYQIHAPWPWPPVLMGFLLRTNVDNTAGYDYSMKTWDDLCLIDVQEFWSLTPPTLSAPTTLGKTSVVWKGGLLSVALPECLHPLITITESAGGSTVWRTWPATSFVDWPPTVEVYRSVRPHPKGGYAVVKWTVHSPVGVVG